MDFDFVKLSASEEDHMEMMLMQMEFSNHHQHIIDSNNNINVFENLHNVNSHKSTNPHPPSVSFSREIHPAVRQQPNTGGGDEFSRYQARKRSSLAAMREMIFRVAAMQPVHIDPESVKPPQRKNVRISTDPQSVAARRRRERISERIRILQRLVPGGTKMDTASMLDEAILYVKFLKNQVRSLERVAANRPAEAEIGIPAPMSSGSCFPVAAAAKGGHQYYSSPHN